MSPNLKTKNRDVLTLCRFVSQTHKNQASLTHMIMIFINNFDSSVRYPAARGRRQGSEWTTAATNPSQDGRQHEQTTVLLYQSRWGPGETCKRAGSAWLYPQIRPLCHQRHASQRDGKVLCRRGGISWARPPPSNDPIKDRTWLWQKWKYPFLPRPFKR